MTKSPCGTCAMPQQRVHEKLELPGHSAARSFSKLRTWFLRSGVSVCVCVYRLDRMPCGLFFRLSTTHRARSVHAVSCSSHPTKPFSMVTPRRATPLGALATSQRRARPRCRLNCSLSIWSEPGADDFSLRCPSTALSRTLASIPPRHRDSQMCSDQTTTTLATAVQFLGIPMSRCHALLSFLLS